MAELKTSRNDRDVDAFLASVENERRRSDAIAVKGLMTEITGDEPQMWGDSIVGFKTYLYTPGAGGAEREWFTVGFSPRKAALTLYIMDGFSEYETLLGSLGKHTTGKSCLYIKKLEDVDIDVLRQLITRSVAAVEARSA